MKNHKINPRHIVDLVNLSTTAFSVWEDVIIRKTNDPKSQKNPGLRAEYMHFVSDILDDLIKATYPLEDKPESPFTGGLVAKSITNSLHPHKDVKGANKGSCSGKCKDKEPTPPGVISDTTKNPLNDLAFVMLEHPPWLFDEKSNISVKTVMKKKLKPDDIVTLKCGQKGRVFGELSQEVYLMESAEGGRIITFKIEDVVSIGRV